MEANEKGGKSMKHRWKRMLGAILTAAMSISLFVPGAAAAAPTATATKSSSADGVKIGAEVLLESEAWKEHLKGKNVALVTNQVCVDKNMDHMADKLAADPDINLVCLFGGEHGVRGAYQAGAAVPHAKDPTTGLPAWSLYSGGTIADHLNEMGFENPAPLDPEFVDAKNPSRPTLAMLTGNNGKWYEPVDVILFDLQEIGSKTWTYMYTLADVMTACVEANNYYASKDENHHVEFIVLDRPSSISSGVVEGTMTTPENASGISRYPLPSRYGLTMGELAKLYQGEGYKNYWTTGAPGSTANEYGESTAAPAGWNWDDPSMEKKISLADCDLTVIPCEGYTRDMYWDETGMGFILPSPNMPTWEAALLYTGTVWFEGPTINEGRGTTKAFELISAPYIDPIDLAQRMNELELPGVRFRPASITVYSSNQTTGANYTNQLSHGVQIHITDKRACSPIQMQTALFLMLQAMYGGEGDQAFNMPNSVDTRVGVSWVREEIQAFPKGATNEQVMEKTNEMLARMDEEVQDYLVIRDKYLMDEYNTPDGKELVNTRQPVVTLGYENLLASHMDLLEGKKVGLVANETSVDKDLNHLADTLIAKGVNLTTLFSTGTGLRGEFQTAEAGQYTDSPVSQKGTGLPVYRLTDEGPTAEQLKDVDVLLFDMQDSGTRANSCVNLMADCMLSCAENGKSFVVLDRPNPLGGEAYDGPVWESETMGEGYAIPTRYGMTLGELAEMIKAGGHASGASLEKLDLTVIPMENWDRDMYYDETGLQFVMSDRKIPTATTLLTYASIGWLEGTGAWAASADDQKGMSSGWGTTKAYEFFGAPFIQPKMTEFVTALKEADLPGVHFRMAAMTPWNNTNEAAAVKYPNKACYGAQLHIADEHAYSPIDTALTILTTLNELFPDDTAQMFTAEFDSMVGNTWMKDAIKAGETVAEIRARFQDDLDAFGAKREQYLLYKEEEPSIPSVPTYSVTVEKSANGTVKAQPAWAAEGSTVTLTASADEGYQLSSLTVTGRNGSEISVTEKESGKYTFRMPASSVTVTAVFTAQQGSHSDNCPSAAYSDVDTSLWYHDAIDYVLANSLMNGYGNGKFGPMDNLSRAMLAQILYNMEKKPAVELPAGQFPDVSAGSWYTDAVYWAKANGIVDGYSDGRFAPDDSITREQLVTMLWRYAKYKGQDVSAAADLSAYQDGAQVSAYAAPAMQWACGTGVVQGSNGKLMPADTATRAEVAQILQNFVSEKA